MGASNNNPFKSGGQLLSEYTVTGKNAQMFITYLTHKRTGKEFLLRELSFTEQRQLILNHERIKTRKSLNNEHLTLLERSEQTTEDNMCSHYFKIYTLWNYPSKTLCQEIKERDLQKKSFESKEIWSILACSIMGLATLQQKDIRHECLTTKSILMDDGNVKVADPLAAGQQTNFQVIFNNRTLKHIYLSPQQCEAIQSQKPIINKNPYKNDVFTMGMILLQCGLLQRQDQCYLDECSRINWSKLQANLRRFGHIYEPDLMKLLSLMLQKDIRHRPDWAELNSFVGKRKQGIGNGQSMPKRDHYITRTVKSTFSRHQNNKKEEQKIENSKFYGMNTQDNNQHRVITSDVKRIESNNSSRKNQENAFKYPAPSAPSYSYQSNNIFSPSYYTSLPSYQHQPRYTSTSYQPQVPYRSTSPSPLPSLNLPSLQLNNDIGKRYSSTQKVQIGSTYSNLPTFRFNNQPSSNIQPERRTSLSPGKAYQPSIIPSYKSQFDKLGKITESNIHNESHLSSLDKEKSGTNQNSFSPPNINDYVRPTQSINYEVMKSHSPAFRQEEESKQMERINFAMTADIPDAQSIEWQPQYVVQHFKVGSRYEGYKVNGMRQGAGRFYYQDGGYYDGQWSQNKMQGQGTLYYQSNHKAYEGQWKSDQFHGHGTLFNDTPAHLDQNFDFNSFDEIDDYWEYYEGNFDRDQKDGQGRLKFSNGEVFEGTFKKDMVQGEGLFTCLDGRKIRGIWRQNHLVTLLD